MNRNTVKLIAEKTLNVIVKTYENITNLELLDIIEKFKKRGFQVSVEYKKE